MLLFVSCLTLQMLLFVCCLTFAKCQNCDCLFSFAWLVFPEKQQNKTTVLNFFVEFDGFTIEIFITGNRRDRIKGLKLPHLDAYFRGAGVHVSSTLACVVRQLYMNVESPGYTNIYSCRRTRAAVHKRLFFSLVYCSTSSTAAPQLAMVGKI